ncbi:SUKH-4 family immunity protein, partial [Streptomyces sp. GC420]|uniref:SUKH-4 family immunity protein n=1 Tax=Streptomyces sp. GC420 TaxID=2697568 RepID=UPI001FB8402A
MAAFYSARARGGAGLIVTGGISPDERGRPYEGGAKLTTDAEAGPGTGAGAPAGDSGDPARTMPGPGGYVPPDAPWAAPAGSTPGSGTAWPAAGGGQDTGDAPGATPWAGTDVGAGADDASVPLPATVFAPPLSGSDEDDTPPPATGPEDRTALISGGSRLPPTAIAPALGRPQQGPAEGGAGASGADIADAATSKAPPPRGARGGAAPPPPPGAPGIPGAGSGGAPAGGPGALGTPAGGYVPTQLVSQLGPDGATPAPPGPPSSGGDAHYAATMLAGPAVGGPGVPPPPGPPGAPGAPTPPGPPGPPGPPSSGGDAHYAATMLAGPAVGGPGAPQPPGPPRPPAYGYPPQQQPTGVPTVGPGYQAVLRFRAADGSEQQIIRRSAPGTPHPEWQILHELRAMNVPPQQVLELHTELESCELPGGYCARMIRETWPQARITSIAPYGRDHASRQQGMQQLLVHQGELHQVADGPARPAPVRAPLPPVQPVPPIPPDGIAHELAGAFGPQGVFRFDQRAVSRQGVPEIVAQTLVWAGLPLDFGPFFWAQAQPGRPVPTLAELAQERGLQPASDAASYLVMGSDFGRAICVQYGTAHIVAVPVESGPGGQPVPPQFVNTGLPEFTRCMALLGRMWRLRFGLTQEQAGRWTVDFQAQLASLDPAALASPESWWSVLLEQMWDGLL